MPARASDPGRDDRRALVAESQMSQGILALHPKLGANDVHEALLVTAKAVRERVLPRAAGESVFSPTTPSRRSRCPSQPTRPRRVWSGRRLRESS